MARRTEPASSRSMASWAIEEEDTGKETGLPLIVCPTYKREDNRADSEDNGERQPGARVLQVSQKCARGKGFP